MEKRSLRNTRMHVISKNKIDTRHDARHDALISEFLFVALITGTLFLIFFSRSIFPEKYFFDNQMIRAILNGYIADSSYTNVAKVYKLFGMTATTSPIIESLVAALVFVITMLSLFLKKASWLRNKTNFLFLSMWGVFYAAYLSQMAKDQIAFLIVIFPAFILIKDEKVRFWTFLLCALIYAAFFRPYWLLIIIMTFSLRFFPKTHSKFVNVFRITFVLVLELIVILVVYRLLHGSSILDIRYSINAGRIDTGNSQSMIPSLFKNTNLFYELANIGYTAIIMILPVHLSALSQIMYYAWLYLILFLLKEPFKQLLDGRTECSIYLLFLLSYIVVQTLFEPDLGSCLRHQIIFFPVIFYLSERNSGEKTAL